MTTENNVAAQAGDEPMLPHHPEPHTHTWSALEAEAIRKYGEACRAAGAAQVSPRATADVEREKLALVIARLEQIAGNFTDDPRNAAEEALVCARAIATTKPGA